MLHVEKSGSSSDVIRRGLGRGCGSLPSRPCNAFLCEARRVPHCARDVGGDPQPRPKPFHQIDQAFPLHHQINQAP